MAMHVDREAYRRPIKTGGVLVTGLIRSGTTWVGKVLSTAKGTLYLHEPLNPDSNWNAAVPTPCNFLFLDSETGAVYRDLLARLMRLDPRFHGKWKAAAEEGARGEISRQMAAPRNRGLEARQLRGIFKDPMALYASEWLVSHCGMSPVVVIRHPIRTVKSMLKLGFTGGNLQYALRQPRLCEAFYPGEHLKVLDEDLKRMRDCDLVTNTALRVKHWLHGVAVLLERHPDWLFLDYSQLVKEPVAEFTRVFRYCQLEPSSETDAALGHGATGVRDPSLKDEATLLPIPEDPRETFAPTPDCGDWHGVYREHFSEVVSRLASVLSWAQDPIT